MNCYARVPLRLLNPVVRDRRRDPDPGRSREQGGARPRDVSCGHHRTRHIWGGCHGRQADMERPRREHPQADHHRRGCRRHPQGGSSHRHQAQPTKPGPGAEVAVGPLSSSGQLRRSSADLILRLRSAATAVAMRLTGIAARDLAGASCKTRADRCAQGLGTMPRGHWRAISLGVTGSMTVTGGASGAQVSAVRGFDLSDSQADSADNFSVLAYPVGLELFTGRRAGALTCGDGDPAGWSGWGADWADRRRARFLAPGPEGTSAVAP